MMILVLLSYVLGKALMVVLKIKREPWLSFLLGVVIILASFELIALPFMLLKGSFDRLMISFGSFILLLSLISMGIILKKRKKAWLLPKLNRNDQVIWSLFFLVLVFQIIQVFLLAHFDADDSFYIAITNAAISSNQIFGFEPSMGIEKFAFPEIYSFTGYEILMAIIAKAFSIQPVILYHRILPILFLPLSYMAWYCLGKKLVSKSQLSVFMLGLGIIQLFSAYSIYSSGAFLLFRSWQGKSIIPCILIPLLFYFFLCSRETQKKGAYFLIMTLILVAGVCTSTVGIYLLPVLFLMLVLSDSLVEKSIKPLLKSVIYALPSLFFLLLYLALNHQNYLEITEIVYQSDFIKEVMKFFNANILVIILYLASVIYLIFKGNKTQRFLFCIVPGILVLTFLNPFLMPFVSKYLTGAVVYWRLFWLIPINISLLTACVLFLDKNSIIIKTMVLLVLAIAFVSPGNYAFNEKNFVNTDNKEKIPKEAIELSEKILETNKAPVILAPPELATFIRQFSGEIRLLWSRETYVEEAYYKTNASQEFKELKEIYAFLYENSGNEKSLLNLYKFNSDVIILNETFKEGAALEVYGFKKRETLKSYSLYSRVN